MKKFENFLEERNKLKDATQGKKIMERKKLEKKLDALLEDMKVDMKEMEKELKHQSKNPEKFSDIKTKTEIFELLKKKYNILKGKYEDEENSEDDYSENEKKIQTLEQFLNNNSSYQEGGAGRDIYEEEQGKIDEWNRRKNNQDAELEIIHQGVGKLRREAGMAGKGINNIGKQIKKVDKHAEKTHKSINTQNGRIKELLFKFRSADKYCCDIILVLIFIGLVCTLYSIIKHKF